MLRKSRLSIALGLALALGVSSVAVAGGTSPDASEAESASKGATTSTAHIATHVDGRVQPRKLPRKKRRNVALFTEVGHDNADGSGGVPTPTQRVTVDFGNNVQFNMNARPKCRANLEGTSTQQARQICGRAFVGAGEAHARIPGPNNITDLVVSVLNGSDLPGRNRLRLHADSQGQLPPGQAAQVIQGRIVNAPGKQFGQRLVAIVPPILGGEGANTLFGATIFRNTGVVQSRCMARFNIWRATWFFTDGTRASDQTRQRCRRRG